jgi:acyl-CoA thioesterase FadM
MAGIVHFSNFFRFMEAAEHAFFRSLGLALHQQGEDAGMSGWARVEARCEYRQPLRYMDEVEVELCVREKRASSLAYEFVFRRVAERGREVAPEEVARGSLRVVHVTGVPGRHMRASEMPVDVARRIEVATVP